MVVGFTNCSDTDITGSSTGKPPACQTPRFTSSARSRRWVWQGLMSRPGVDDADDRLAHELFVAIAHLQRARAMAEGAQVARRTSGRSAGASWRRSRLGLLSGRWAADLPRRHVVRREKVGVPGKRAASDGDHRRQLVLLEVAHDGASAEAEEARRLGQRQPKRVPPRRELDPGLIGRCSSAIRRNVDAERSSAPHFVLIGHATPSPSSTTRTLAKAAGSPPAARSGHFGHEFGQVYVMGAPVALESNAKRIAGQGLK